MLSYLEKCTDLYELPSLIILDYSMPLMNGLETLIRVKKIECIEPIPVLIYSTTINELLRKTALDFGACASESKAMNVEELKSKSGKFANIAYSFMSDCRRINVDRAFG